MGRQALAATDRAQPLVGGGLDVDRGGIEPEPGRDGPAGTGTGMGTDACRPPFLPVHAGMALQARRGWARARMRACSRLPRR